MIKRDRIIAGAAKGALTGRAEPVIASRLAVPTGAVR